MESVIDKTVKRESGNILLIGLAVIAAISVIAALIINSGGGADDDSNRRLSPERAQELGQSLISYGLDLVNIVISMRGRGTPADGYSFAHPLLDPGYGDYNSDPLNEVFNPSGGGALLREPVQDILIEPGTLFGFFGTNVVLGMGTDCTGPECSDLVMALPGIRAEICANINAILAISDTVDDIPEVPRFDSSTPFRYGYGYAGRIGDTADSSDLNNRRSGCFLDQSSNEYVFYQVLLAR